MDKPRGFVAVLDGFAVGILFLEAFALAGTGIIVGLFATESLPEERRFDLGFMVVCVAFAIGLFFVATGYARRKRYAVVAALVWQLLQGASGVALLKEAPAWGWIMIGSAVIVLISVVGRIARNNRREPDDAVTPPVEYV